MSTSNIAKTLGIDKATLSRKISGQSDFYRNEIAKLCKILDLTSEEIMQIFLPSNLLLSNKQRERREVRKWTRQKKYSKSSCSTSYRIKKDFPCRIFAFWQELCARLPVNWKTNRTTFWLASVQLTAKELINICVGQYAQTRRRQELDHRKLEYLEKNS